MSADSPGSITLLVDRLRTGEPAAANEICQRFLPRLVGLARKALLDRTQRAADAEDAVQSALVSFWQRATQGEFPALHNRDELWNLLGLITVRKALKQSERERAQKRGGGRVAGQGDLEIALFNGAAHTLPAHDFDLYCDELLQMLEEPLRQIAVLKLLGHSTAEIAQALACTERKVQRKLEIVRLKWEREVQD